MSVIYVVTSGDTWVPGMGYESVTETYPEAEKEAARVPLSYVPDALVERFIYEVTVKPVMKSISERVTNFREWDGDTDKT